MNQLFFPEFRLKSFFILSFLIVFNLCYAQPTESLESNKKGLEILRASFVAHGGVNTTDSLRVKFSVINQRNITPGQTYAADEKGDEYILEGTYSFDKRKKRESAWIKTPMSGFEFVSEQVVIDGKGISISHDTKRYQESSMIRVNTQYLPQFLVNELLKTPFNVRYVGESAEGGVQVNWISGVRGTEYIEIAIDKNSKLVRIINQLFQTPGAGGDTQRQIFFRDYQAVGGGFIAQEIEVRQTNKVIGSVSNIFRVKDITDKFEIDATKINPPTGYSRQDFSYRKMAEVKTLAKDIYMIENSHGAPAPYPFSYNILFAEFEDFVLVVEAPWDGMVSQRVIKLIQSTIPGKPIRYLVQTHHHEDHIGGIRTYIAEGVKIISSPSNVEFINKISNASFVANPDRLASKPTSPLIEPLLNKKRVIKDKRNEVIIQDIGPNIHTKDNLVVYFPNQKLLYQADMINEDEYPLTATSKEFLAKWKELKFQVDVLVGTHGKVLNKESVTTLLSLK